VKGAKITHQNGDHDDFINAAAGAIDLAARGERRGCIAIGVETFGSRPLTPYGYGMTTGYETV
jgi:hypothetical protein